LVIALHCSFNQLENLTFHFLLLIINIAGNLQPDIR